MIRPRWQGLPRQPQQRLWHRWDQAMALLAVTNLAWVLFDVSYIPLRNFWLQRNLYPLPTLPLVVPLPWLPDITPHYDRVKGIEPHRSTRFYGEQFKALDRALNNRGLSDPLVVSLLDQQLQLTQRLMDTNPFVSSGNTGALEKIKSLLRSRANEESARAAASELLSTDYLQQVSWSDEGQFWRRQILPLVEINYWRSIDASGQPTDLSWRIDLPFQLLFLLDIGLRSLRLRQRYPAIRWRDALLRRWIDLPLLLPIGRVLRIIPVTERLSGAGLIQLEPLRAVISRGVVALLALELFEVITIRVVDALQQLIRSPRLPQRIRSLRSHQSTDLNAQPELIELLRLWVPLLMVQVGPSLRPQLVDLFHHVLRSNLADGLAPESISRQLASGAVDSLLNVSRRTGERLGTQDEVLSSLGTETLDRFWDELARVLEDGPLLERSQNLLASVLEELKLSSFRQLRDQGGVAELIRELDGLSFSPSAAQPRDQP